MFLGYYSGHILSLTLGSAYPVYRSFKSLQPSDAPAEQWLPYWILFAIFSSIEFVLDFVFAFWLPFYYELKVMLVLYLQPVYFDGAAKLYTKYLEPLLVANAPYIDEKVGFVAERAKNFSAEDLQKLVDFVTNKGGAAMKAKAEAQPDKPASPPPEEPAEVVEKETEIEDKKAQ